MPICYKKRTKEKGITPHYLYYSINQGYLSNNLSDYFNMEKTNLNNEGQQFEESILDEWEEDEVDSEFEIGRLYNEINEVKRNYKVIIFFIIFTMGILTIFLYGENRELDKTRDSLAQSLYNCQLDLDNCRLALEEANNNIEEASSIIEEAQGYSWSSYEDMGNALDNLYTVDTVSEP